MNRKTENEKKTREFNRWREMNEKINLQKEEKRKEKRSKKTE